MARFDDETTESVARFDPIQVFESFLDDLHLKTDFGRDFNDPDHPRRPTCYLDYLFLWLAEGEGALYCPTFEDWLLCVIRFADDLYTPRVARLRLGQEWDPLDFRLWGARTDERMGLLDWGAASHDEALQQEFVDHVERHPFEALPVGDVEGMHHPALDRNVYERCRQQALERRQLAHMERLLYRLHADPHQSQ